MNFIKKWFSWKARYEALAAARIKALNLNQGDVLIIQSDDLDEVSDGASLRRAGEAAGVTKRIPILGLSSDDSIDIFEIDQALEWLQKYKESKLAEQNGGA